MIKHIAIERTAVVMCFARVEKKSTKNGCLLGEVGTACVSGLL